MKKNKSFLFLILCLLFCSLQTSAQGTFVPDENTSYIIRNRSTSKAITRPANYVAGGYVVVADYTGDANQQFKFVPAGTVSSKDQYKIQSVSNGDYVTQRGSQSWNSQFTADGSQFWIDKTDNSGYVYLRNAGTTNGLGLDAGSDNVYANKGNGSFYQWIIYPAGENFLFILHEAQISSSEATIAILSDFTTELKQPLIDAIATAKGITSQDTDDDIQAATANLLSITNKYNPLSSALTAANTALAAAGIYDPQAKLDLQNSLATAKASTNPDIDAIAALAADIQAKITAYKNSETQPVFHVEDGVKYRILLADADGNYVRYMTKNSDGNKVLPKKADYVDNPDNQLFYFEAREGFDNEYYIKNVASGKYLDNNGNGVGADKNASWIVSYKQYVGQEPYYNFTITGHTWQWSPESGSWPDAISNMWVDRGQPRLFTVAKDPLPYDILKLTITDAENLIQTSANPVGAKTYLSNAVTVAKAVQDGNDEVSIEATKTLKASIDVFNDFTQALADAKAALTLSGDFPKVAKDALQASINAASALSDANAVVSTIEDLKAKTQAYINSQITPVFVPKEEVMYRLYAVNDAAGTGERMYFGSHNDWNCGAKTLALDFVENQVQLYIFEGVQDQADTYLIKSTKSGKAIRTNGHTDPGYAEAPFKIKYAKTKNGVNYYTLQMTNTGNYLGFGNTTPVSIETYVSSMSTSSSYPTEEKYFWAFEEDVVTLKRELLLGVLTEATVLYNTTEAGEGAGQYPAELRESFDAAIKAAQAIYQKQDITEGDIIKDAYNVLSTAIAEYKAGIIIPGFNPETGAKYRIYNPSVDTFYSDSITGSGTNQRMRTQDFKLASESVDSNQQWIIESIQGVDSAFVIKNSAGKVFTYNNVNNNKSGFVMSDLKTGGEELTTQYVKIQYAYTDQGTNYFFITTYRGTLRTIAVSSGVLNMEAYNAANRTTQPVEIIKVEANDLNKTKLDKAIKAANSFLMAQFVGTELGNYPEDSVAIYQDAIDVAKVLYNKADATQEQINAGITPLTDAKVRLENAVIVDFASYRELLVIKTQIWQEAEVGTAVGEYYQSALDAIAIAIEEGRAIARRGYVTKSERTALDVAAAAWDAARNTKVQQIDAVLQDAIDADQLYLNGIGEEGTNLGQPATGSKAIFQAAITKATNDFATAADDNAKQGILTILNAARKTFENGIVSLNYTELNTSLAEAKGIMAERSTNEGEFEGKYPTSAYEALQGAIDVIEYFMGIPALSQQVVNDTTTYMKNAVKAFNDSKIVIDFSELTTLSTLAESYAASVNAEPGSNFDSDLTVFKTAITTAKSFIGSAEISQEGVSEKIAELTDAVTTFIGELKDVEGLGDAVIKAQDYYDTTPTDVAELQSALTALETEITNAEVINNSVDMAVATQTAIKTAVSGLNSKVEQLVTLISKDLKDMITEAEGIHSSAVVGNPANKDEYSEAQKAALNSAITSAKIVLNAASSRYDNFDLAVINLTTALNTFLSKDLVALIVTASDALDKAVEGNEVGQYAPGSKAPMNAALEVAQDAVDGAESNFKKYYDDAYKALKDAYDHFIAQLNTGMDDLAANGISIYANNGKLYIAGIDGEISIIGYDMSGRTVFADSFSASEYNRELPVGNYVISITGYVNGNRLVIVK